MKKSTYIDKPVVEASLEPKKTPRIHVVPSWTFRDEQGESLNPKLFELLAAIARLGKLTLAAKAVGFSYRHAWNQLNKWADFFGLPLVELHRGRGAQLTVLGDKLLWAQQRVSARLEPELENISSEINLQIQQALDTPNPLLRIQASHGYAVALLPDFLQNIQLDLHYTSAEDALKSLSRGECELAGFHLPAEPEGLKKIAAINNYLNSDDHGLLRFISRQQGLMVKADNPKSIRSVVDLQRLDVRFINRQKSSGTRALLDQLLAAKGINQEQVQGYTTEEFTHSAVAAYVAAGMADVGFGVRHAAHQFGLKFYPLCREHYLFAYRKSQLSQLGLNTMIEQINTVQFRQAVTALAGYSAEDCGAMLSLSEIS